MTFNVFGLLKILTYLNDEIMNVPKKIINKRDEGDLKKIPKAKGK